MLASAAPRMLQEMMLRPRKCGLVGGSEQLVSRVETSVAEKSRVLGNRDKNRL